MDDGQDDPRSTPTYPSKQDHNKKTTRKPKITKERARTRRDSSRRILLGLRLKLVYSNSIMEDKSSTLEHTINPSLTNHSLNYSKILKSQIRVFLLEGLKNSTSGDSPFIVEAWLREKTLTGTR